MGLTTWKDIIYIIIRLSDSLVNCPTVIPPLLISETFMPLCVSLSDWPIYNDSKTSRGRYEMPRTNYMARLADSYLRSTLSFNGLDSVLIRFCFIQSLLNISVPQMGTNGALALAPAAPSTPPTSPVTVKKIRIIIFYHRRSS